MKTAPHQSSPQSEKWAFNRRSGRLSSNGSVALQFTDKESIALAALLQSPNYPVSHTQLFDLLRSGGEEYDAHRIDALIYRVRRNCVRWRSAHANPQHLRRRFPDAAPLLSGRYRARILNPRRCAGSHEAGRALVQSGFCFTFS
jgi:hypothetical protein